MKEARILYGSTMMGGSHFSEDILWKTRFAVPDPVFFIETEHGTFLFTNALECGRAKREAKVDEIIDGAVFNSERRMTSKNPIISVRRFLAERNIKKIIIPSDFPGKAVRILEKRFAVQFQDPPFYRERIQKTDEEISYIKNAQKAVEAALQKAVDFLKGCPVYNNKIWFGGEGVTSEQIKEIINLDLYKNGYLAGETIVASGRQAAEPHNVGSGVLEAHTPIIIDIFPVDMKTHYWGDMTRTFFRGEPSKEIQKMYNAVLYAQTMGIEMVRAGALGFNIWDWMVKFFEQSGYPKDSERGRGFIHSTGHGLGMQLHEYPRIGTAGIVLEERYVVTIEPGLYYPTAESNIPIGGIRIEDAVVVTKDGCQNLNSFPKDLDSMIL